MQLDPACRPSRPWLDELGVVIARVVQEDMDAGHQRVQQFQRFQQHKDAKLEQLIEAVGANCDIWRPYSTDMNPIEKAYSKWKAFLRKIA